MKSYKHKTGVTLVEILIVVAVIAILVTMVIGIAARIDSQGKERLTENTFALLDAALGEFQDYGYSYKHSDYAGLNFPLDCNGFNKVGLETTLANALGAGIAAIIGIDETGGEHVDIDFRIEDSGCEALCFFLNCISESRQTLDKVGSSLITNEGTSGGGVVKIRKIIRIDGKDYPFLRIIDPWGKTLRYDYYNDTGTFAEKMKSKKTFPVITSAGPDKSFGTNDDISTRK